MPIRKFIDIFYIQCGLPSVISRFNLFRFVWERLDESNSESISKFFVGFIESWSCQIYISPWDAFWIIWLIGLVLNRLNTQMQNSNHSEFGYLKRLYAPCSGRITCRAIVAAFPVGKKKYSYIAENNMPFLQDYIYQTISFYDPKANI